jgi:hypothetical protein
VRLFDHTVLRFGVRGVGGTWWPSWLRRNLSFRNTDLRLTQPLTGMSTKNISWGVKAAGALGRQIWHLHVSIVFKSGSRSLLNSWTNSWTPSVPFRLHKNANKMRPVDKRGLYKAHTQLPQTHSERNALSVHQKSTPPPPPQDSTDKSYDSFTSLATVEHVTPVICNCRLCISWNVLTSVPGTVFVSMEWTYRSREEIFERRRLEPYGERMIILKWIKEYVIRSVNEMSSDNVKWINTALASMFTTSFNKFSLHNAFVEFFSFSKQQYSQ